MSLKKKRKVKPLQIYSDKALNYTVTKQEVDGIEYFVVPVVMMKEGVHNGSAGQVYHPIEVLANSAEYWDGIPVVVEHPQKEGKFISANTEGVPHIGYISNSHMEGDSLKASLFLEKSKIESDYPVVNEAIITKQPLDVSIGSFATERKEEGQWNDEQYIGVVTNLDPDHLALLPGHSGACSWADGCGIRVNQQFPKKSYVDLIVNKLSIGGVLDKLHTLINSMDEYNSDQNIHKSFYLEEAFDKYFIYKERNYATKPTTEKIYKQNYTLEKDEIIIDGMPIEVIKEVKYKQITNNKKKSMAEQTTPCCKERIDALIANTTNPYTEEHRGVLEALDEKAIEALETVKAPEPQVNKETAVKTLQSELKTTDDWINAMPNELQDSMRTGLALNQQRRDSLITSIMANAQKDTWTKDELQGYSTQMLEKIQKTTGVQNATTEQPVVYLAQGHQQPVINKEIPDDAAMYPDGVE